MSSILTYFKFVNLLLLKALWAKTSIRYLQLTSDTAPSIGIGASLVQMHTTTPSLISPYYFSACSFLFFIPVLCQKLAERRKYMSLLISPLFYIRFLYLLQIVSQLSERESGSPAWTEFMKSSGQISFSAVYFWCIIVQSVISKP